MCGIYGWFGAPPSPNKLQAMGHAIRHRGPDGYGANSQASSSIGNCRLAIVDKAHGQQPFSNESQSISVVCNGEIYNHQELRSELQKLGHQFHTECDIEVLPHAWEQWGEDMLPKLNGMFTIAIQEQDTLTVIRDRCGQKPLYLAQNNEATYFASEIRALLAAGIRSKINNNAIIPYLVHRYVPEPQTMFEGITTLPAGHLVQFSNQQPQGVTRSWWKAPSFEPVDISESEAVSTLESLVNDSVSIALQGEEKIATYLSAGVDSSLLLHTIREAGYDTTTFTAGFGAASDEVQAATDLAKKYNVPHHSVICKPDDFDHLHQVVGQMELPVGDALILAFDKLSSRTAQEGFRVAIGGDGIDETMLGYSFQKLNHLADQLPPYLCKLLGNTIRHTPIHLLNRYSPLPSSLGTEGREKIGSWFANFHQSSSWHQAVGLRTLFTPEEAQQLSPQHQWSEPKLTRGSSSLEKQALFQFQEWLQDWAIIRNERNSMAHSVEYRIPFLDHRIIDFTASLPLQLKINRLQGKHLWRKFAATKLPKANSDKAKKPFYFPLEEFRNTSPFTQLVQDCLSQSTIEKRGMFNYQEIAKIIHSGEQGNFLALKKMVSLIVLELWQRNYID